MVIAIEGISGVGKSTLIRMIKKECAVKGYTVHSIKHDSYDKLIRKAISRNHEESVLLFLTLHKYIQNHLNEIKNDYDIILLDRSLITTLVYGKLYQKSDFIYNLFDLFKYREYPIDNVFCLHDDVRKCLKRLKKADSYESLEKMEFFNKSFQDPILKNLVKFLNKDLVFVNTTQDDAFIQIINLLKEKNAKK